MRRDRERLVQPLISRNFPKHLAGFEVDLKRAVVEEVVIRRVTIILQDRVLLLLEGHDEGIGLGHIVDRCVQLLRGQSTLVDPISRVPVLAVDTLTVDRPDLSKVMISWMNRGLRAVDTVRRWGTMVMVVEETRGIAISNG